MRAAQTAAPRLGLDVVAINAGTENEIDTAFAVAVQKGAGAVYVGADAFFSIRHEQISALAFEVHLGPNHNRLFTSVATLELPSEY